MPRSPSHPAVGWSAMAWVFPGLRYPDLHLITGGGRASAQILAFNWVNIVLGNVKNAITGSYHAIRGQHVPRYLAEGAIAGAAVGEHPGKADTQAGVVAHGPKPGQASTPARLVRVNAAEGDSRVVVDGHMDILPSCAWGILLAISSHTMPRSLEASQLLAILVQEVPKGVVLIVVVRPCRWQNGQPIQPFALENASHCTLSDPQRLCNLDRSGAADNAR